MNRMTAEFLGKVTEVPPFMLLALEAESPVAG